MSYESECAIIAALAVALLACLGNSVKVRAVELPSSTVAPLYVRVGLAAREPIAWPPRFRHWLRTLLLSVTSNFKMR